MGRRVRFEVAGTGTDDRDCVPDGPDTFVDRLFFVFLDRGGGVGDEVDARLEAGVVSGMVRLGAFRPRVEVVGVVSESVRLRLLRVFDDGGPCERKMAMSMSGVDAKRLRARLRVRGRVDILRFEERIGRCGSGNGLCVGDSTREVEHPTLS